MASGKTTVGKLVAERLGFDFADLDDVIAAGAGASVAQMFAIHGEAGFRQRESEAVRKAAGRRRTVFATGGGAACREENLAVMLEAGRVIALTVSAEEAVRRAGDASGRPLLDRQLDKLAAARSLLAAREPFYARAELRVATDGRSAGEVADEVMRQLAAGRRQ